MTRTDEPRVFEKFLHTFNRWEKIPSNRVTTKIFLEYGRCVDEPRWSQTWSEIILLAAGSLRESHE